MSPHQPVVVVLASGKGERFKASGGQVHKLKALLAGKPVLEHTLQAVRASGLPWHLEDVGHAGMGDSIAAAVRATQAASGWLILPGDLPLIQSATLIRLASALATHFAVVPVHKGQRGHPVGFSAACRDALMNLQGNKGAALVLAQFSAIEIDVNDVGAVTDIDTLDDLARAEVLYQARSEDA